MIKFGLTLSLLILTGFCKAQTVSYNLYRKISLDINREPASEVLHKISKAGGFYFSYSGVLFKPDSIVSIKATNVPVKDVLDSIFKGKIGYKERNEYVILRHAARHFIIEPEEITMAKTLQLISGYVIDTETGEKVKQVSVYEKRLLKSALTDKNGYFKLRFKGNHTEVILTASKEAYRDTSFVFLSDIKVKPQDYVAEDPKQKGAFNVIENSGLGRFFISSRQRIQSLNLPDFFVNSPFQASLIPGLSSHGMMSPQIVNKGSLNVIGGYTAGINGVEIAGLFNFTKGDVRKVQIGGLFNEVGGDVEGVQVAGIFNQVKQTVKGVQIAGLSNLSKDVKGMQIAGLTNIAPITMEGVQVAGLLNYAKKLRGIQIGLVNISDESTGYSIGLINYTRHGYHKISLSANEIINTNLAFKTGNANLYNIIFVGKNFSNTSTVETAGLGFGHDFLYNKKLSVAAELTSQFLYLGNWEHKNMLNRIQTSLQYQISKGLTLYAGPAYSIYVSDAPVGSAGNGYKQQVAPVKHHNFSTTVKGWAGWNAGITIM